ncbi:uncharacterized protein LOC141620426 [Silene latifolia]|uniref:uncharacterized protein LOC141620426 n=1 Tax=Silene latifolia TaxID=37657 RepID=UPI003D78727A
MAINKVHQGLSLNWAMVTNNTARDGGRIWVIWDDNNYEVEILSIEAQVIHAKVKSLPTSSTWWMSVVYGFNRVAERTALWELLVHMDTSVNGPWVVMGDFNNVLAMCERIGSEVTNAELRGFQDCVDDCGLVDFPAQGAYYTWNNKHELGAMVFSRIDRAMANDEWLHIILRLLLCFIPKSEKDVSQSFKLLEDAKHSSLAQKAKAQWFAEGDDNTKYFHSTIKARRVSNWVLSINDMNGNM